MRSLYLRFFLVFWAAMILVLACTVAATLWLASERFEHERERQEALARQASAVLASEGVPGLRPWLVREQANVLPDRLFLLDAQGHDLLGRPVPEFLQAALGRRPFPAAGAAQARADFRLLSQLVSAQTHEVFALSLLWAPGGPLTRHGWLGAFASPETPLVTLVITLLVSGVICYLLARFLSAPIQHLRAATHAIAGGDLSVRVSGLLAGRRDELAMLAVDFDAMTGRLRSLLESRQQLLRDISHELRSPLARLQIALGLARRPAADLQREHDRIEQEAQRLDELIGEILGLVRLDDPGLGLVRERVALAELLEGVVDNAQLEGDARGIRLGLVVPADASVHADSELLQRAVENVVRNAVRYSPDGGQVTVAASADAAGVHICIEDQGPGVPQELLGRIFEPFFRVASARERDSGGNGIGLAIAARVMSLHGGGITASNRAPHGLQVRLTLPRT